MLFYFLFGSLKSETSTLRSKRVDPFGPAQQTTAPRPGSATAYRKVLPLGKVGDASPDRRFVGHPVEEQPFLEDRHMPAPFLRMCRLWIWLVSQSWHTQVECEHRICAIMPVSVLEYGTNNNKGVWNLNKYKPQLAGGDAAEGEACHVLSSQILLFMFFPWSRVVLFGPLRFLQTGWEEIKGDHVPERKHRNIKF